MPSQDRSIKKQTSVQKSDHRKLLNQPVPNYEDTQNRPMLNQIHKPLPTMTTPSFEDRETSYYPDIQPYNPNPSYRSSRNYQFPYIGGSYLDQYHDGHFSSTPFPGRQYHKQTRQYIGQRVPFPYPKHHRPLSESKHPYYRVVEADYDCHQYRPPEIKQNFQDQYICHHNQDPNNAEENQADFDPQLIDFSNDERKQVNAYNFMHRAIDTRRMPIIPDKQGKKHSTVPHTNFLTCTGNGKITRLDAHPDKWSCETEDNFTELEILRGDDLGVVKPQPLKHTHNIPKLDRGHEDFWNSPMLTISDETFPARTNAFKQQNFHHGVSQFNSSNLSRAAIGHPNGSQTCGERRDVRSKGSLEKKMLEEHIKVAESVQKYGRNKIEDHQLRCLDKVAQWISTLDVLPTVSSTTSGVDVEYGSINSAVRTPNQTNDAAQKTTFKYVNPELNQHMIINSNEDQYQAKEMRRENQVSTEIETGKVDIMKEEDQPGQVCSNMDKIHMTNVEMSTQATHVRESKSYPFIDKNMFPISHSDMEVNQSLYNQKISTDVQEERRDIKAKVSEEQTTAEPGGSYKNWNVTPRETMQVCKDKVSKVQTDQSTKGSSEVNTESTEENDIFQERQIEHSGNLTSKGTEDKIELMDDGETSIFEGLNFIYYQGASGSHMESEGQSSQLDMTKVHYKSAEKGMNIDPEFCMEAMTSPWKNCQGKSERITNGPIVTGAVDNLLSEAHPCRENQVLDKTRNIPETNCKTNLESVQIREVLEADDSTISTLHFTGKTTETQMTENLGFLLESVDCSREITSKEECEAPSTILDSVSLKASEKTNQPDSHNTINNNRPTNALNMGTVERNVGSKLKSSKKRKKSRRLTYRKRYRLSSVRRKPAYCIRTISEESVGTRHRRGNPVNSSYSLLKTNENHQGVIDKDICCQNNKDCSVKQQPVCSDIVFSDKYGVEPDKSNNSSLPNTKTTEANNGEKRNDDVSTTDMAKPSKYIETNVMNMDQNDANLASESRIKTLRSRSRSAASQVEKDAQNISKNNLTPENIPPSNITVINSKSIGSTVITEEEKIDNSATKTCCKAAKVPTIYKRQQVSEWDKRSNRKKSVAFMTTFSSCKDRTKCSRSNNNRSRLQSKLKTTKAKKSALASPKQIMVKVKGSTETVVNDKDGHKQKDRPQKSSKQPVCSDIVFSDKYGVEPDKSNNSSLPNTKTTETNNGEKRNDDVSTTDMAKPSKYIETNVMNMDQNDANLASEPRIKTLRSRSRSAASQVDKDAQNISKNNLTPENIPPSNITVINSKSIGSTVITEEEKIDNSATKTCCKAAKVPTIYKRQQVSEWEKRSNRKKSVAFMTTFSACKDRAKSSRSNNNLSRLQSMSKTTKAKKSALATPKQIMVKDKGSTEAVVNETDGLNEKGTPQKSSQSKRAFNLKKSTVFKQKGSATKTNHPESGIKKEDGPEMPPHSKISIMKNGGLKNDIKKKGESESGIKEKIQTTKSTKSKSGIKKKGRPKRRTLPGIGLNEIAGSGMPAQSERRIKKKSELKKSTVCIKQKALTKMSINDETVHVSVSGNTEKLLRNQEKKDYNKTKEKGDKSELIIPCSINVLHYQPDIESDHSHEKKEKSQSHNFKRKSTGSDTHLPKQRKVSKTSSKPQRFAARPWKGIGGIHMGSMNEEKQIMIRKDNEILTSYNTNPCMPVSNIDVASSAIPDVPDYHSKITDSNPVLTKMLVDDNEEKTGLHAEITTNERELRLKSQPKPSNEIMHGELETASGTNSASAHSRQGVSKNKAKKTSEDVKKSKQKNVLRPACRTRKSQHVDKPDSGGNPVPTTQNISISSTKPVNRQTRNTDSQPKTQPMVNSYASYTPVINMNSFTKSKDGFNAEKSHLSSNTTSKPVTKSLEPLFILSEKNALQETPCSTESYATLHSFTRVNKKSTKYPQNLSTLSNNFKFGDQTEHSIMSLTNKSRGLIKKLLSKSKIRSFLSKMVNYSRRKPLIEKTNQTSKLCSKFKSYTYQNRFRTDADQLQITKKKGVQSVHKAGTLEAFHDGVAIAAFSVEDNLEDLVDTEVDEPYSLYEYDESTDICAFEESVGTRQSSQLSNKQTDFVKENIEDFCLQLQHEELEPTSKLPQKKHVFNKASVIPIQMPLDNPSSNASDVVPHESQCIGDTVSSSSRTDFVYENNNLTTSIKSLGESLPSNENLVSKQPIVIDGSEEVNKPYDTKDETKEVTRRETDLNEDSQLDATAGIVRRHSDMDSTEDKHGEMNSTEDEQVGKHSERDRTCDELVRKADDDDGSLCNLIISGSSVTDTSYNDLDEIKTEDLIPMDTQNDVIEEKIVEMIPNKKLSMDSCETQSSPIELNELVETSIEFTGKDIGLVTDDENKTKRLKNVVPYTSSKFEESQNKYVCPQKEYQLSCTEDDQVFPIQDNTENLQDLMINDENIRTTICQEFLKGYVESSVIDGGCTIQESVERDIEKSEKFIVQSLLDSDVSHDDYTPHRLINTIPAQISSQLQTLETSEKILNVQKSEKPIHVVYDPFGVKTFVSEFQRNHSENLPNVMTYSGLDDQSHIKDDSSTIITATGNDSSNKTLKQGRENGDAYSSSDKSMSSDMDNYTEIIQLEPRDFTTAEKKTVLSLAEAEDILEGQELMLILCPDLKDNSNPNKYVPELVCEDNDGCDELPHEEKIECDEDGAIGNHPSKYKGDEASSPKKYSRDVNLQEINLKYFKECSDPFYRNETNHIHDKIYEIPVSSPKGSLADSLSIRKPENLVPEKVSYKLTNTHDVTVTHSVVRNHKNESDKIIEEFEVSKDQHKEDDQIVNSTDPVCGNDHVIASTIHAECSHTISNINLDTSAPKHVLMSVPKENSKSLQKQNIQLLTSIVEDVRRSRARKSKKKSTRSTENQFGLSVNPSTSTNQVQERMDVEEKTDKKIKQDKKALVVTENSYKSIAKATRKRKLRSVDSSDNIFTPQTSKSSHISTMSQPSTRHSEHKTKRDCPSTLHQLKKSERISKFKRGKTTASDCRNSIRRLSSLPSKRTLDNNRTLSSISRTTLQKGISHKTQRIRSHRTVSATITSQQVENFARTNGKSVRTRSRQKSDDNSSIEDDGKSSVYEFEEDADVVDDTKKNILFRLECKLCKQQFLNRKNLDIHCKHTHKGKKCFAYICIFCSKRIHKKRNVCYHFMDEHSDENWEKKPCPYCFQLFPVDFYLPIHINKLHGCGDKTYVYECRYCDLSSQCVSIIQDHFKKDHSKYFETLLTEFGKPEDVQESVDVFVCKYCNLIQTSIDEFLKHFEGEHSLNNSRFQSNKARNYFVPKTYKAEKLSKTSDGSFLCLYCHKKSSKIEEVNVHIQNCHKPVVRETPVKIYSCLFCIKSVKKSYEMKKHIGKCHWLIEKLVDSSAILLRKKMP